MALRGWAAVNPATLAPLEHDYRYGATHILRQRRRQLSDPAAQEGIGVLGRTQPMNGLVSIAKMSARPLSNPATCLRCRSKRNAG